MLAKQIRVDKNCAIYKTLAALLAGASSAAKQPICLFL